MKRFIHAFWGLAAAATLFGPAPARAGLIGDQVQVVSGYVVGTTATVIDARSVTVASPTVELPDYLGLFNINIEDDTIGIQFLHPVDFRNLSAAFAGFLFSWNSSGPKLTGTFPLTTDIPGFNSSHVAMLSPTLLAVDFHDLNVALNQTVSPTGVLLGLNFQSIPEPQPYLLMAMAIPLLILVGHRAHFRRRARFK